MLLRLFSFKDQLVATGSNGLKNPLSQVVFQTGSDCSQHLENNHNNIYIFSKTLLKPRRGRLERAFDPRSSRVVYTQGSCPVDQEVIHPLDHEDVVGNVPRGFKGG